MILLLKSDLVSVIIPCHNGEKWIEAAVTSALDQTWRPIEIIIVDDGSQDNSLSVCEGFADNPLVNVIAQTQQGASVARNTGIRFSKGAWFQFLDADDLLAPDKVQLQMERAVIEGDQFLYSCSWGRFYNDTETSAPDQSSLCISDLEPIEWVVRKYSGNYMMPVHSWLVPRAIIKHECGWDEKLSLNDDGEYFDRIVMLSQGVKYVSQAKCYYRTGHTESLSRSITGAAADSAKRSIDLGCSRLLAIEDSERTREACAIQMQLFAYQFYPIARGLANQAAEFALHLGGSNVDIPGGLWLKRLSRVIGWRMARWLQYLYYNFRCGNG